MLKSSKRLSGHYIKTKIPPWRHSKPHDNFGQKKGPSNPTTPFEDYKQFHQSSQRVPLGTSEVHETGITQEKATTRSQVPTTIQTSTTQLSSIQNTAVGWKYAGLRT